MGDLKHWVGEWQERKGVLKRRDVIFGASC